MAHSIHTLQTFRVAIERDDLDSIRRADIDLPHTISHLTTQRNLAGSALILSFGFGYLIDLFEGSIVLPLASVYTFAMLGMQAGNHKTALEQVVKVIECRNTDSEEYRLEKAIAIDSIDFALKVDSWIRSGVNEVFHYEPSYQWRAT